MLNAVAARRCQRNSGSEGRLRLFKIARRLTDERLSEREAAAGYSPSPCGPPPRSQSLCGEGSSLKGCTSSTITSPVYAVATRARYARRAPPGDTPQSVSQDPLEVQVSGAHGGLAVVELRRPQLAHPPAAVGFLLQPALLALSVVEPAPLRVTVQAESCGPGRKAQVSQAAMRTTAPLRTTPSRPWPCGYPPRCAHCG